jgi:hypothetical protein
MSDDVRELRRKVLDMASRASPRARYRLLEIDARLSDMMAARRPGAAERPPARPRVHCDTAA